MFPGLGFIVFRQIFMTLLFNMHFYSEMLDILSHESPVSFQ